MNIDNLKRLRHPSFSFLIQSDMPEGICLACGEYSTFEYQEIINNDLVRQWEINRKQRHAFSSRESRQCKNCGAIYRNRQLSGVLIKEYGDYWRTDSLKDLVNSQKFQRLRIAEINACGHLHQFLKNHPKLCYSEFEADDPSIKSEDIQELSYKDKSFDLVLTSDTLEHIPDYKKALNEIRRVLKPSGRHIFTIPIIWQRRNRRRAEWSRQGSSINYILTPSYHGPDADANLVWTEFGNDILEDIDRVGFKTKVYGYNLLKPSDPSCVLISTKLE